MDISYAEKCFSDAARLELVQRMEEVLDTERPETVFRINAALLAEQLDTEPDQVLDILLCGVLHGVFNLNWDFHCPHCNGLSTFDSHLGDMSSESYCPVCQVDFRNQLDNNIEVTFTVAPEIVQLPEEWVAAQKEEMYQAVMEKRYRMPERYISGLDCFHNSFFHNNFSNEILSTEESLEIRNVALLFTDIKGSTELYEQLGDAQAYKLVREHFKILFSIIEKHHGVVVKTIGDAVMASFQTSLNGVKAALEMQQATKVLRIPETEDPLHVKLGLHTGPAIAVTLNERLDYFGQTVNKAARVQGVAKDNEFYYSKEVRNKPEVKKYLAENFDKLTRVRVKLKGIAEEIDLYRVREGELKAER